MKFKHRLLTQTQLGKLFGVSSHQIGKWLIECDLKDRKSNRPTQQAHHGRFCDTAPSRNNGYCWAWAPEKTVPRLIAAGHELIAELPIDLVEADKSASVNNERSE